MPEKKFQFDVKVCHKCKFFDGNVDTAAEELEMFYCSKLGDYIDKEGHLQRFSTKVTIEIRKEWKKGYDSRVLLCPFHLEHTVSQESTSEDK